MHNLKNMILKNSIIILLFIFCQGCSNTYWVNNRSNANWNIESAQCEAYANGNAPNPAMQAYDYGGTFSGSGVVGSTPYFYSGTIAPDHAYNMQAGLNNAANAFTALAAKQNIYEQCLRSLGWVQVDKSQLATPRQPNKRALAVKYVNEKNYNQAKIILEELCDEGDNVAQYNLGVMYAFGHGVNQDLKKAQELFELSANQGNDLAQYNLGRMYIGGFGINKDLKKAEYWLEKSANQGNDRAKDTLAGLYIFELKGNDNYNKGRKLLEEQANKNSPQAFNSLGYIYLYGLGVNKDFNQSKNYFDKAINLGFDPALDSMGELYEKGFKNKKVAISYYEKACNKNVKEGCDNYKRLSQ